jgi:uncharacterized protein YraI
VRAEARPTLEHMFDEAAPVSDRPHRSGRWWRWSRWWERLGFAVTVVLVLESGVGVAAPVVAAASGGPVMVSVRTPGDTLNERSGPSTWYAVHGVYPDGARVSVVCRVWGQQLSGSVSTSAWWLATVRGWYVAEAFVVYPGGRSVLPWCDAGRRAAVARVRVAAGATLSVRAGPGTDRRELAVLADGRPVSVACRVWGQPVGGRVRATAVWDRLSGGGFVSDGFVAWSRVPVVAWCGEAPQSVPPVSRSAFVAASVGGARAGMARYRVPASVTIAQAILESGAGVSTLTRVDHNVFGMKCFGDPGRVAIGCRGYGTFECGSGCYRTRASFRAYADLGDSFVDHGLMLSSLARYRPCFRYVHDPDRFAQALQAAGYATDPHYARSLIRLMRQYNLYKYDH